MQLLFPTIAFISFQCLSLPIHHFKIPCQTLNSWVFIENRKMSAMEGQSELCSPQHRAGVTPVSQRSLVEAALCLVCCAQVEVGGVLGHTDLRHDPLYQM